MATEAQLIEGIKKADAAGDTEGVKALGNALIAMRSQKKPDAKPAPAKGNLEQLWDSTKNTVGGIVEGAASIPDMLAEHVTGPLLSSLVKDKMKDSPRSKKELAKGGLPAAIETVRSYTAAPLQWLPGADKAAESFDHPITIGGLARQYLPKPDAPGASIARFGSNILGGAAVSEIPAVKAAGGALMEAFGAKSVPKTGIPVPKATNEIVDEGRKAGVRVLTTDVKPPTTFIGKNARSIGERIPFAGTGGVRSAQQAERLDAIKTLVRDYGGDDTASLFDTAPSAIEDVAKNLTATRGKAISTLVKSKDAVIDGVSGAVPTPKAAAAIDEQIAQLKAIGAPELDSVIGKLEGWKQAMSGKPLRSVEELRKIMGEAFNDPGLASVKSVGQKAVNAIYGPLREDMGNFIKTVGAPEDFNKWKIANAKLADMVGDLNASTFKSALKNADVTPEAVGRLLFSKNASDVQKLVANLDTAGKARAQAAVLQKAFDKAISVDSGLSAERFVNNLTSLGDSVGVVFKGADLVRVKGLTMLLDGTRHAAEAAAMPTTGVQNAPAAVGYSLGALFGQAAIPVAALGGLFARAYESAPVRDLLLKLGQAPAGSVAERVAVGKLTGVLAAVARRNPEASKLPAFLNDNVPKSAMASDQKSTSRQNVMGYPIDISSDHSQWGRRPDGTNKGDGFLGPLRRPDGNVSTEISVGVEIGGKEREIPLMVPGLTKPELDYLMTHDPESADFQRNMPPTILDKAVANARTRIARGQSPFK